MSNIIKIFCIFIVATIICLAANGREVLTAPPVATNLIAVNNLKAVKMAIRIEYKKGQEIGDNSIKFIKELEPSVLQSGRRQRKALFLCNCKAEFTALIKSIKCNHTKSCGCYRYAKYGKSFKIGYSNHKFYGIYNNIIKRCSNIKTTCYKYYGGRGIKMCDEFLKDPFLFFIYIESLDNLGKRGYTLDRINNDGNYERGNLRWANKTAQVLNRRKSQKNTSGYTGIYYYKKRSKWVSGICINYTTKFIGEFALKKDAVNARNKYILDNKLTEHKIQDYV